MKYIYTLPQLPYEFGALEPYVDALTMEIHHDGHHKAYVDNLNAALQNDVNLQNKSLDWLVQNYSQIQDQQLATAIRNNGGGHWNHTFFWNIMAKNGGGLPKGKLAESLKKKFENFEAFQSQFNNSAKKVFGSGWAWLCVDTNGELVIVNTINQDNPITQGLKPVIGLDVWEHAYYLKYRNKRPDYINAWWNVVNWEQAEQNYIESI